MKSPINQANLISTSSAYKQTYVLITKHNNDMKENKFSPTLSTPPHPPKNTPKAYKEKMYLNNNSFLRKCSTYY